eukprot:GHVU01060165.1.p1 GENE.GHVU01060165.1~~GHVU01060165.1.p1  ORF type:complete len:122 (-),score=2.16 GHVU01060165.1:40-405(-)
MSLPLCLSTSLCLCLSASQPLYVSASLPLYLSTLPPYVATSLSLPLCLPSRESLLLCLPTSLPTSLPLCFPVCVCMSVCVCIPVGLDDLEDCSDVQSWMLSEEANQVLGQIEADAHLHHNN